MFSFHKPKIYRSALGCCICRAKSSSSRFTDSKKYEAEFARCFRIVAEDRRSGEICNACVLLVKRWKKLPPGTTRDWHHVVDARAGPGTKSGNKGKVKPPKRPLKKHHRLTAEKRCKLDLSGGALSDDITKPSSTACFFIALTVGDESLSESSMPSPPESRAASPTPSNSSEDSGILDEDEEEYDDEDRRRSCRTMKPRPSKKKKKKRKQRGSGSSRRDDYVVDSSANRRGKLATPFKISSFLDMSFWRKEKVCCGIIFKGPHGEVLIYPKLLRPCRCRRRRLDNAKVPEDCADGGTRLAAEDVDTTTAMPINVASPSSVADSSAPVTAMLTMSEASPTDDLGTSAALLFPTPEISDCNPSSPDASENLSRGSTSPDGASD
nr:SIN3-HDAC complex-associated factor-like isoform X1 [Rhipicephalus microplus]